MSRETQVRFCERPGVKLPRATHLVMCFQKEQDTRAMRKELDERMAKFGLKLHPEKTRVIRFGRYAREENEKRGLPKPQTFDFLGFTHVAGLSREGKFQLQRRTSRKKRRAKLARLKDEVRKRRHSPVVQQHARLSSVLTGHYRYYGVPTNYRALNQFRERVQYMWHASLQRRSQRGRWNQQQYKSFNERFFLPRPHIHHPWPHTRFALRWPKVGARCGKTARRVLSGGRIERAVPTGTSGRVDIFEIKPFRTSALLCNPKTLIAV